jgi:hypothetical protein
MNHLRAARDEIDRRYADPDSTSPRSPAPRSPPRRTSSAPSSASSARRRTAYQELKARGVDFLQEPAERFYGTEALFRDPFGNWFSLTERKSG